MQLPGETSGYMSRVRYGRYVSRRLRQAKLDALATAVEQVTKDLKAAGRAWEDADEPVQDALADRDAADDLLDTTAQEARNQLAGRSVSSAKEEPYTLLFGEGIAYYIAAPLDEEARRYKELVQRAETHLKADDPVRAAIASGIPAGLEAFTFGAKALESAKTASSLAGTEHARATERWTRQLEKTYGALLAELGKPAAERFFPRIPRAKKAAETPVKPL